MKNLGERHSVTPWTFIYQVSTTCNGFGSWFGSVKEHDIDIVYSHYQEANLIAVLAQYFTTAKFVITRHHSDCGYIDRNYREIIGDKIINRLAKVYIAPSQKVFEQIIGVEGANAEKVRRIDYGYNFSSFTPPDADEVAHIKETYSSQLLLVKAARLIPEKRHLILFRVLKDLVAEGLDIKALILGRGNNLGELEAFVKANRLENHIFFLGFRKNVQDYYAAADLVVHLSLSEASNSAIKEAGLIGKTAIVCKEVGDFSDYLIHGQNGFLLDKHHPDRELRELLQRVYDDKLNEQVIGQSLKKTVINRFSVANVFSGYDDIHENLFAR